MIRLELFSSAGRAVIPAEAGERLSGVLRRELSSFALPCAGNHTCGKCRVKVAGAVSEPEDFEKALLGGLVDEGIRLACSCRILGDLTVRLLDEGGGDVISWYETPSVGTSAAGYGFAADIGTTTVAVQLLDRSTGRVLAERLGENAQRGYGADVISRIAACKTAGLDVLSRRIREQLEDMAAACLKESGVSHVDESVVTGNSTMLHLYEGLDPASLAAAPFSVQSYFGGASRHLLAGAPVYLPRCVGAYVGADIICAVLAADMTGGGTQLLVDIGTNGEIVLSRGGKLLCCAAAAGPAFEGAGLSCGMPAAPGAIRRVSLRNGETAYETVGRRAAAGVCGSGILDALAVMRETGVLDESGYLERPWEIGDSGICVTQKDVRQIQLAKAAVCAGIQTLLSREGLTAGEPERFVIAGGFGNSMNQASAARIGLFPAPLRDKAAFIGNGALGGAAMLLRSAVLRRRAEALAEEAEELALSESGAFMDRYIDGMALTEAE